MKSFAMGPSEYKQYAMQLRKQPRSTRASQFDFSVKAESRVVPKKSRSRSANRSQSSFRD